MTGCGVYIIQNEYIEVYKHIGIILWDDNQNTQDVLGPRLGMNNHLKFPTNNALALISTHNISDTYNLITFCCKLLFGRCLKKLTI